MFLKVWGYFSSIMKISNFIQGSRTVSPKIRHIVSYCVILHFEGWLDEKQSILKIMLSTILIKMLTQKDKWLKSNYHPLKHTDLIIHPVYSNVFLWLGLLFSIIKISKIDPYEKGWGQPGGGARYPSRKNSYWVMPHFEGLGWTKTITPQNSSIFILIKMGD